MDTRFIMDDRLKQQAVRSLNHALGIELQEAGPMEAPGYTQYTGIIKAGPLPFYIVVELGPREGEGVASCYIKVYALHSHNKPGEEIARTAGGHLPYAGGEWLINWN